MNPWLTLLLVLVLTKFHVKQVKRYQFIENQAKSALVKEFLFHSTCKVRNGNLLKSEICVKRIRVNQGVDLTNCFVDITPWQNLQTERIFSRRISLCGRHSFGKLFSLELCWFSLAPNDCYHYLAILAGSAKIILSCLVFIFLFSSENIPLVVPLI